MGICQGSGLKRVRAAAKGCALAATVVAAAASAATVQASGNAIGGCAPPGGKLIRQRLPADPFHNRDSAHATEVEPAAAASPDGTIVTAFQVGRHNNGGSRDIGVASSSDGCHWTAGYLPNLTQYSGGDYKRVTDPTVAYDSKLQTWLAGSLVFNNADTGKQAIVVNRSADGVRWQSPVPVYTSRKDSIDKPWLGCDNSVQSPDYGNCYAVFDDVSYGDAVEISRSFDGGQTWSTPVFSSPEVWGLGGEPVIQPSGRVIIPLLDADGATIDVLTSDDGGATFQAPGYISTEINGQVPDTGLRADPLPSTAMDASGRVYVVWSGCRRVKYVDHTNYGVCSGDDLLLSYSDDGTNWSAPKVIPTGGATKRYDNRIPTIAIDPSNGGAAAQIAVTYYTTPDSHCSYDTPAAKGTSRCTVAPKIITSADGGTTWSQPRALGAAMPVSWLAPTDQGYMAGDYGALVVEQGRAFPVFPLAERPRHGRLDETMRVILGGVGL